MRSEMNRAANSGNEGDRITSGEALDRTPQAEEDHFALNTIADNTADQTFIPDIMANDADRNAKSLWSMDNGISFGSSNLTRSAVVDTAEYPVDTRAPQLTYCTPWDEGTLKIDQNIILNFDESIVAGSGSIIISNGVDTRVIDINDTSQVTFASVTKGGRTITIDPTEDLIADTHYNIQIASGVILDMAGNAYKGISDPETLDFMSTASNPLLIWNNPWNEETLKADDNIALYFDEAVVAGSGAIIISNGSDTRTIDIQDTNQVTFDDYGGVIINPTDDLIPDTHYAIQIAPGAILDIDGHAYAGINDTETLNFITTDPAPVLYWSNLQYEGILKADNHIELYFDEMVVAGSGAIIISNGSDTRTIDIQDTNQVTFDGYGGVIINPTDDLILNTNYHIQIASGVIQDVNGHAYEGIDDSTTLNFTAIASDPLLTYNIPGDESLLKIDGEIRLGFDEHVMPGSGSIVISNGTDTRFIDINDSNQVTFSGGKVTINPADDLISDTHYHIQIAPGVILDNDGHTYAGISDPDTLNFTTISSSPLLTFSNPADDATEVWVGSDIYLYFDEMVVIGAGNIILSNGTDIRTINLQDTSQVMFDGYSSISINPAVDLVPNTDYFVQIDSGVITDMTGNPYAGIYDTTTLNFTTTDSPVTPMIFPSLIDLVLF